MEYSIIDFNKVNEMFENINETHNNLDKVEFEKFLYNLLSINNLLTNDDILELDLDYINRIFYVLDRISFRRKNESLLNNKDYLALLDLYRFDTMYQNIENSKHIKNNLISKSLMLY